MSWTSSVYAVVVAAVLLTPAQPTGSAVDKEPGPPVCGGLIAYNEQRAGANSSQLMVVPAAGGGTPQVLWDREDAGELDPAWSPDGHAVAFAGRLTNEFNQLVNNRLYVLRAGAAEPELVVEQLGQRGGLRYPAWSPDGARIAYISGVPPEGQPLRGLAWIYVVDLARPLQPTFITGVPIPWFALDLAWSPRGDQLLVTAATDPFIPPQRWAIYSLRPDPVDPQLTPLISDDAGARASTGFPAFLPVGNAVLVEQDELDLSGSRLYLADPELRHLVPMTTSPGWETQPDFGRSPLHAVYQQYSADGTETSIGVLTLPTGALRTLVEPTEGVYVEQPDWQPVLGCQPWPFPGM